MDFASDQMCFPFLFKTVMLRCFMFFSIFFSFLGFIFFFFYEVGTSAQTVPGRVFLLHFITPHSTHYVTMISDRLSGDDNELFSVFA